MIGGTIPRSVGAVTLAQVAALVLPAAAIALDAPAASAALFAAAAFAALTWEALFSALRGHAMSFHGTTTALIVTILVPADIALWQLLVVVSMGSILGELIFGGRGFGFASAATVSLALALISFPQLRLVAPTETLALATLPGAAFLLWLGLIPWRVFLAVPVGTAAFLVMGGQAADPAAIGVALVFGLTFLICDPIAASATPQGQWLYGALCGALIVLFSPSETPGPEAIVFAALLGSIFAPLIDHLVALVHTQRRRRRHV